MKLKSITIHGFKSFADRVTISYDHGITGVIGPNGSGKSNVIDAVRWVMGEQTAKSLRADDPTDIIFAGSQSRKPMGMAEVTLTFANDGRMCPPEYLHLPECSITRRIYRDGEREYLLNKESCRLKDIAQFLMSIGLGSRTYSIIQQERRDRIVQAKPDDLRAILEETAGISVFKVQRKDAEKRLHTTKEQLEKLEAVETELERQSEHLSEQVEKTKLKLSLSKELRDDEVALLGESIAFHRGIAHGVRDELGKRKETTQKSTVDTAAFEAEASRLTAQKLELTNELDDKKHEIDEHRLMYTKLTERRESQITLASERSNQLRSLEESLASERQELENSSGRIDEASTQMEAHESAAVALDAELEELGIREEEISERARTEQSKTEGLRTEKRVLADRVEQAETQLASLTDLEKVLDQRIEEKKALCARREAEIEAVRREVSACEPSADATGSPFAALEQDIRKCSDELATSGEERSKLKGRHEVKHRQLVEIDARLRSLRELVAEHEGAADPKVLHSFARYERLFDNIGLEPEYEDRFEAAFPERVAAHIVPDLETLAPLTSRADIREGQRQFAQLQNTLKGLSSAEKAATLELVQIAGVKPAVDVLSRGQKSALRPLFERIFFCETLEGLAPLLDRADPKDKDFSRFVFILPDGGSLTGLGELRIGKRSEDTQAGLLKRKREIAGLEKTRESILSEVQSLESSISALDDKIESLDEQGRMLRNKLSERKEEAIRREAELSQLRMRLEHLGETLASVRAELEALLADLKEQSERKVALEHRLAKDSERASELSRQLEDLNDATLDVNEELGEIRRQIQNRRELRQQAAADLAGAKRSFEELSLQQERSRQKVTKLETELETLRSQLQNTGKTSTDLEADIERLRENVAVGEAQMEDLSSRIAILTEQIHVLESKIGAERDAQLKTERYIAEKQSELARAEAILETLYRDAWERFELSETDFAEHKPGDDARRGQLEGRIKNLRKQLEGLGPINEAAVAEYEETAHKLQFLREQKDDVTSSIEALQQSISEVEDRTKVSFLETYEQVGARFSNLFPILFPGGEARLNLVDPENLLETGVEILVRLPGKRMQNMSLFSGGEKALTAISLIFALLQNSPAPFCFLDEVDAPLDEANVGRFNSVLEALSDEFQFVVITHNRRTMEVLDTIYGISMNDPGVSRLVSVDLSEVPGRLKKAPKPKKEREPQRQGATAEPTSGEENKSENEAVLNARSGAQTEIPGEDVPPGGDSLNELGDS